MNQLLFSSLSHITGAKHLSVWVILALILSLTSCTQDEKKTIRLGINPWPGYEFLYLGETQHIFKDAGLAIEIVQLNSLADVKRAYLNGRIDAFGGTLIEALQLQAIGAPPLKTILIPDFSNGADVIITRTNIATAKDLKGKRVGGELASLGYFILARALKKHGLGLSDIDFINVEQSDGAKALQNGDIDAFVTYPPASADLLKSTDYHTVFSSADIPNEVVDIVAFKSSLIDTHLIKQFYSAWDKMLEYTEQNPEAAYATMAGREQISVADFKDGLSGLKLNKSNQQAALLKKDGPIQKTAMELCDVLKNTQDSDIKDCTMAKSIVFEHP